MRYLPLSGNDRREMLEAIGLETVDALFAEVPLSAQRGQIGGLPDHQGEMAVERHLQALAARNLGTSRAAAFLGAGAYRHHIPASVDALIQRGEFLTSYTPYQPEISQGTLQMLFEFQSQVCEITGMEVANASMYDDATAAAEAVNMAMCLTARNKALISGNLHPHYRDVIATQSRWTGVTATLVPVNPDTPENLIGRISEEVACFVVQTPDFFGHVHDYTTLADAAHAQGALLIVVVTEIVSLGLLPAPGAMDADIVVGEGPTRKRKQGQP